MLPDFIKILLLSLTIISFVVNIESVNCKLCNALLPLCCDNNVNCDKCKISDGQNYFITYVPAIVPQKFANRALYPNPTPNKYEKFLIKNLGISPNSYNNRQNSDTYYDDTINDKNDNIPYVIPQKLLVEKYDDNPSISSVHYDTINDNDNTPYKLVITEKYQQIPSNFGKLLVKKYQFQTNSNDNGLIKNVHYDTTNDKQDNIPYESVSPTYAGFLLHNYEEPSNPQDHHPINDLSYNEKKNKAKLPYKLVSPTYAGFLLHNYEEPSNPQDHHPINDLSYNEKKNKAKLPYKLVKSKKLYQIPNEFIRFWLKNTKFPTFTNRKNHQITNVHYDQINDNHKMYTTMKPIVKYVKFDPIFNNDNLPHHSVTNKYQHPPISNDGNDRLGRGDHHEQQIPPPHITNDDDDEITISNDDTTPNDQSESRDLDRTFGLLYNWLKKSLVRPSSNHGASSAGTSNQVDSMNLGGTNGFSSDYTTTIGDVNDFNIGDIVSSVSSTNGGDYTTTIDIDDTSDYDTTSSSAYGTTINISSSTNHVGSSANGLVGDYSTAVGTDDDDTSTLNDDYVSIDGSSDHISGTTPSGHIGNINIGAINDHTSGNNLGYNSGQIGHKVGHIGNNVGHIGHRYNITKKLEITQHVTEKVEEDDDDNDEYEDEDEDYEDSDEDVNDDEIKITSNPYESSTVHFISLNKTNNVEIDHVGKPAVVQNTNNFLNKIIKSINKDDIDDRFGITLEMLQNDKNYQRIRANNYDLLKKLGLLTLNLLKYITINQITTSDSINNHVIRDIIIKVLEDNHDDFNVDSDIVAYIGAKLLNFYNFDYKTPELLVFKKVFLQILNNSDMMELKNFFEHNKMIGNHKKMTHKRVCKCSIQAVEVDDDNDDNQ